MTRTFVALAALFIACRFSFAQDATLVQAQGPVFVRLGGSSQETTAKGGEELLYGDGVKTGPGGVAHVLIGSRGAVLIRENSLFTLEGDPERTLLKFSVGEFLVGLRKKLVGRQAFRVVTPAAVAAVRGTLFWGKSDEAKTATFAGFGHSVAVTGKGKTVLIRAGETTTVAFGQAPAAPAKHDIPVSYLDNFKIGGSLQELEALIALPKTVPAPGAPRK